MRDQFQKSDPLDLAGLMETEDCVSPALPLSEAAGTRIGRYKLLQLIGEGGFGSVFMAEQETPVVRKVALKIIKLGMDTKQVIARFEAERQALAMMDHPNIARVLDAGATDTGRPFFVMELVKGIPITDYCDQKRLSPKARLELFIAVCKAVQHAHQKGIIHRDIKPSNVMVTLHDGTPVPKVIDFGIAKAVNQRLTEHTLFTEYRQLIGTPEYTSPEQADLSGLDVDTRSDIYSLGVLLYQLLTGTTPFDSKTLRKNAYGEIQRIIREVEPQKPSTRLSTMGASLQTVADRMDVEPKRLTRLMAGELDWIVMKCLEKDRARRYDTASNLAGDVQRHLDGEPVEASPPSAIYRTRKFVRKHRIAIGIVSLLLCATAVSVWQALLARHARGVALAANRQALLDRDQALAQKHRADQQAGIAEAVNAFLNEDVLSQASPNHQGSQSPPNPEFKIRDALDNASLRIAERFRTQPLIEAKIRGTIGQAYADLGEWVKAEQQLDTSLELLRKTVGEIDPAILEAKCRLADLYLSQEEIPKSITLLEEVLEGRRQTLGRQHRDTMATSRRLAHAYSLRDQFSKAEPLFRETLNAQQELFGEQDPETLNTMSDLAMMYWQRRQYQLAAPLLIAALDGTRKQRGERHPDTIAMMENIAVLRMMQRQYPESEALFSAALEGARAALGEIHPTTLGILSDFSFAYENQRQYARARVLVQQAINGWRKRGSTERDKVVLHLRVRIAELYAGEGSLEKAESILRDVQALAQQAGLVNDEERLGFDLRQAELYLLRKDYAKAEPIFKRALAAQRKMLEPGNNDIFHVLCKLIEVEVGQGKYSDALPLSLEAAQLASKFDDVQATRVYVYRLVCRCYRHTSDQEQARKWTAKLDSQAAETLDNDIRLKTAALAVQPSSPDLLMDRGRAYGALGEFEKAAADFDRAIKVQPKGTHGWLHGMALFAQCGDMENYDRSRAQALQQFQYTSELLVAHEVSKGCLILPIENEELALAARLAERAEVLEPGGWHDQGMGMAEYRQGHYEQAVSWLLGSRQSSMDWCRADSEMYLALAYARMGRREEAISALQRGTALVELDLPHRGEGDTNTFQDWILCDLARREAESILGALAIPSPPIAKPPTTSPARTEWQQLQQMTHTQIREISADLQKSLDSVAESELRYLRARLQARLGNFAEAAPDYVKGFELDPANVDRWERLHEGIHSLLQVGDVDAFKRRRSQALRLFSDTKDFDVAHCVAKDALMVPIEGDELHKAERLADMAIAASRAGWGAQSKGMAEFRAGHYQQAIQWLTDSSYAPEWGYSKTIADLFLSMCYEHTGDHPAAQAAFARATRRMDKDFPRPGVDILDSPEDWVLCQVVRREAEALINGPGGTPSPGGK